MKKDKIDKVRIQNYDRAAHLRAYHLQQMLELGEENRTLHNITTASARLEKDRLAQQLFQKSLDKLSQTEMQVLTAHYGELALREHQVRRHQWFQFPFPIQALIDFGRRHGQLNKEGSKSNKEK
ncbi:MAG: hypothetical protein Q7R95_08265 [bacterium]|nr:hypothetical protein [bacterium]